jgi:uncharacterized Zn-finger protein
MKRKLERSLRPLRSTRRSYTVTLSDSSDYTDSDSDFICKTCHKSFSSKQCLKEHSYKHSNQKPYSCTYCGKRFRHASQFTLHKQSHKNSSKYLWPKLEEMEKRSQNNYRFFLEVSEKIDLPSLSGPQMCTLPSFESIINHT